MAISLNWKWRLLTPVVLGAATMFVVASLAPKRYRAAATIIVVAQQVSEAVVPSMVETSLAERLPTMTQRVLSRSKLESIIAENDLYPVERKTVLMDDVVDLMRRDIEVVIRPTNDPPMASASSFTVSYTSPTPQAALKVTERLANLFRDENIIDRESTASATMHFLETQIDELRANLLAKVGTVGPENLSNSVTVRPDMLPAEAAQAKLEVLAIERGVLIAQYKSLLAKRQDARVAANLEAQQRGQQFKVIESPRLPDRPVGPTRTERTVGGAVIGFGLGVVWLIVAAVRRSAA